MQTYTSKETSISTVNKVYKDLPITTEPKVILDYGCGKYNNNKEIAESKGYIWLGYDPYNRTDEENNESMLYITRNGKADIVICSNVLNVIAENDIIQSIANTLPMFGNKVLVTIYEGDKSGIGKVTKKGYQRNEKAIEYTKYFHGKGVVKGNIITI